VLARLQCVDQRGDVGAARDGVGERGLLGRDCVDLPLQGVATRSVTGPTGSQQLHGIVDNVLHSHGLSNDDSLPMTASSAPMMGGSSEFEQIVLRQVPEYRGIP
jgi:hypothetical protein